MPREDKPRLDPDLLKITEVRLRAIRNAVADKEDFNYNFLDSIQMQIDTKNNLTINQVNAVKNMYDQWVPDRQI